GTPAVTVVCARYHVGVRVVIVMPERSYRAAEFLAAAARAGAEVWVASDRCHVLDRVYLWPERSLVVDFYDPDAAVERIVAAGPCGRTRRLSSWRGWAG